MQTLNFTLLGRTLRAFCWLHKSSFPRFWCVCVFWFCFFYKEPMIAMMRIWKVSHFPSSFSWLSAGESTKMGYRYDKFEGILSVIQTLLISFLSVLMRLQFKMLLSAILALLKLIFNSSSFNYLPGFSSARSPAFEKEMLQLLCVSFITRQTKHNNLSSCLYSH